jgi:hypothetical protein
MTDETPAPIRFGFLPIEWMIEFDYGKIIPIPEFKKISKIIKKHLHHDGNFYPPTLESVFLVNLVKSKKTRKTKRPTFLYPVPPSHDLFISPPRAETDIREGSAGFILHLLAFLFHTRLQFADWYYDGRIPIDWLGKEVHNPYQAGKYLSLVYKIWLGWQQEEQKRFTNILYMYSRRFVYEWEWEEFIIQYMVLDACWKMAENLFGLKARNHADRIKVMCNKFSMTRIGEFIDLEKLVGLRNDLFHETLWHGGSPGSARSTLEYSMPIRMGCLIELLISALINESAKQQQLI